jgi:hypothetical protein
MKVGLSLDEKGVRPGARKAGRQAAARPVWKKEKVKG